MKKLNRLALTASMLSVLLCSACTFEGGGVSEHDLNRIVDCKDTRDGEEFSFNSSTVRNVRHGIGAPTSFTLTTLDGKEKKINSDMEAFLKCDKRT